MITNKIPLPLGKMWLDVRAYDPFGNNVSAVISITIQTSVANPPGTEISGYNIGIIIGMISIFTVFLIKKRKNTNR